MDTLMQAFSSKSVTRVVIFNLPLIGYVVFNSWQHSQQKEEEKEDPDQRNDGDTVEQPIEVVNTKLPVEEVHVQVYTPQKAGMEFVRNLYQHLSNQDNIAVKLNFVEIDSVKEINADQPLLVICMNTSRLGTDAKHAVKGIQDSKSAVLLVFHHKDEHALPNQPSARVLVESEFKDFYGIYDIACLTGKGVYACDMNTKSVSNVLQFIDSFRKVKE